VIGFSSPAEYSAHIYRSEADEYLSLTAKVFTRLYKSTIMADSHDPEDTLSTPLNNDLAYELLHAVNDAIFVQDPETGEILDVNETMCEMYGYSREEACQLNIDDLSTGIPPYTHAHSVEYVEKAAAGNPQVFEWQAKDSEGNIFWVEVSMRRAFLEDDLLIVVLVRDISERKAHEEALQNQRDNLKLLNEIIRHDIRNDLQLVTAYAELLEDHVDKDGKEYLETLHQSAWNAVDLTVAARDLSQVMLQSHSETEAIGLASVLQEQVEATRKSLTHADITIEGSVPQVSVEADGFLESVFRNLLKNAVQHNDKDYPKVTVTAEQTGDLLEVRIADNGPGIPESRKEEIFGKGEKGLESEGTGIGLYLDSLTDGRLRR